MAQFDFKGQAITPSTDLASNMGNSGKGAFDFQSYLGGASIGMDFLGGYFDLADSRKRALAEDKALQEEIGRLGEYKKFYGEMTAKRKENATDVFGNKVQSLATKIGLSRESAGDRFESEKSKSDLAYSGTLERKEDFTNRSLDTEFKGTRTSLYDSLETYRTEQDFSLRGKEMEIDNQIARINAKRKGLQVQQKEKYLGIFG